MVEPLLYAALGFLTASLVALFFGRALWNRAVRLTTHRIMRRLPLSRDEIVASRDLVRAQLAVEHRRLERQANIMRERMTASMADVGRRNQDILDMKAQIETDRAAIADWAQREAAARNEVAKVGAELNATRQRLSETERLLAITRDELEIAQDDTTELVRLADDRKVQSATVQSQSAQSSQVIANLERQLAAARQAAEEIQERLNRTNEAVKNEHDRAESIHQKLVETESNLSQALTKLDLNEREFQKRIDELQAEKNNLLGQLSVAQVEMDGFARGGADNEEMAALRREIERLASDIARVVETPALETSASN
jgi:chromosome segregation ATPase